MSFEADIQKAWKKISDRDVFCFVATVTAVDKNKGICSVKDNELEYTDVLLSAVIDANQNKSFVFPAVGSSVLVEPIYEDIQKLYVSKYSEVESLSCMIQNTNYLMDENGFEAKVSNAKFKMDANGFQIKRNNETLKVVLNDFIDEVNKIIVVQGTTINVPAMILIKQRLNTVLT